MNELMIVFKKI